MSSPPSLSPSSSDLPPKRKGKAIRHDVSKPLENTRLSQLINILIAVSVLMTAVYTYRLIQYKNHVGGWGNLALGMFPEWPQGVQFQNTPGEESTFTDVLFSDDNKESNNKGGSEEGIFGKAGTIAKAVMGADHEPELVG
ncbi:hypothetical protein PNOK_0961000 [Pyrrhoderma noxium]|uniref:Uncharacterized protein n=1 Tax=Pyrrhoderma noxium TaxID=2282107 RepID=A0A286U674_9AGAM|nr:hypothetical protein PNOK_0961000 [Pyrrhoderma noxium]